MIMHSGNYIKYEDKAIINNDTVLSVLHIDGSVLCFGRATINELDSKYSNLSHEDKIDKCCKLAYKRAKDNFLAVNRKLNKDYLIEQITCHGLYLNYLTNNFENIMKSIIKSL